MQSDFVHSAFVHEKVVGFFSLPGDLEFPATEGL